MAPIKFEDNIREELQERQLQPSKNAWAKLEGKLDTLPKEEKENGKGNYLWYAVAASFIGLVIIASFVFKNDGNDLDKTIVHETSTEKTETNSDVEKKLEIPSEEITPNIITEQIATETPAKKASNTTANDQVAHENKNQKIAPVQNKKEVIAINQSSKKKENSQRVASTEPNNLDKTFEAQQIDKVVAKVEALKNENKAVTAAEVDALLKNAQREIQTQRILNNTKVDAMALLDDVEFEMEQTFREKVFTALGEGFDQLRTVVVERNQ